MCPCKAQLAVPQEKPCCLQFKPPHERRAHNTERGYKRKMRKKMRNFYLISSFCLSGWTRGKKKKMLTCSLAVFSASNSFCNLSDLSSAPSACSCKNLIFRLTASSDVVPAIVYCSTIFFFKDKLERNFRENVKQRDDVLDCDESAQAFWRRAVQCLPAICPGSAADFKIGVIENCILQGHATFRCGNMPQYLIK